MQIVISLKALRNNIQILSQHPHIPVVKADFYGLGYSMVSELNAPTIAVASIHDAREVEQHTDAEIIILNGVSTKDSKLLTPQMVPALTSRQIKNFKGKYAVFADEGCTRFSEVSEQEAQNAAYYLVHNLDYTKPCAKPSYYQGKAVLSVGNSQNFGLDSVMPRIGQAYTGYSTNIIGLRPVKTVYADIIDRVSNKGYVGYNYEYPEAFKDHFIYSIDVGRYHGLYTKERGVINVATSNNDLDVVLFIDPKSINLNNSFIASPTRLSVNTRIELLGANMRADFISEYTEIPVSIIQQLGRV